MCFILFWGLLNCHILSHACKQWHASVASVSNGYYPATHLRAALGAELHPNRQMVNTTNQVTASKSQRSGRNLVFHLIILTYQRILPKWYNAFFRPPRCNADANGCPQLATTCCDMTCCGWKADIKSHRNVSCVSCADFASQHSSSHSAQDISWLSSSPTMKAWQRTPPLSRACQCSNLKLSSEDICALKRNPLETSKTTTAAFTWFWHIISNPWG